MWSVNAFDVKRYGRTPGGEYFTEFVNAIIQAQALASDIPLQNVETTLRTNIADGGVDTKVNIGFADRAGWMTVPTIWQFKATDTKDAFDGLKKEVNKPYAKSCIEAGFAYRYCVCDEITSQEKERREKELTLLIKAINTEAPAPMILSAGDLAAWASLFPGCVMFVRPQLADRTLHLQAWRDTITAQTATYVPVSGWEPVRQRMVQHLDWSTEIPDMIFSLQGEAGVGKTRLVYETLNAIPGMAGLVVYTRDEEGAKLVARLIANGDFERVVLVADECSVQSRSELIELLRGRRQQVRIIAIDNSGERPLNDSLENVLLRMPREVLDWILKFNFPYVSAERRRFYVGLCDGFVRLAADMCVHDSRIMAAGHTGPAAQTIRDYVSTRFSGEDLKVVEALSLLDKVGYAGEVADELTQLCALVGMDRQRVQEIAHRLHDTPGFVARAGRYFYITPEVVAQSAFDGAWRRLSVSDPQQFLDAIPKALLEAFLRRVARSASEEVRALVGQTFRRWATSLTSADLANLQKMDRLIRLIETDPDTYYPVLERLIKEAAENELRSVSSSASNGRWGTRRQLVWLAERMAAFPEYFAASEQILCRLALAENEQGVGNNATEIWKHLFRITLSGTAIPFDERSRRLKDYLSASNPSLVGLANEALDELLSSPIMRMLGSAVVAGRIPPSAWNPQNGNEEKLCYKAVLEMIIEQVETQEPQGRTRLQKTVVNHLRRLLHYGLLPELQRLFAASYMTDEARVCLIAELEEFLEFDVNRVKTSQQQAGILPSTRRSQIPDTYVEQVKQWLGNLQPQDLHARLVTAIGGTTWKLHHHIDADRATAWNVGVERLAEELLANQNAFEAELPWLCSAEAGDAPHLGRALGRKDVTGGLLDQIYKSSMQYQASALIRGYTAGLLDAYPIMAERVNAMLDHLESDEAPFAFELALAGGDITHPFERAIRMIDAEKLPVASVQAFSHSHTNQPLTDEQFNESLKRLIAEVQRKADRNAARVALEMTAYRLEEDARAKSENYTRHPGLAETIWDLLRKTFVIIGDTAAYWWAQILKQVLPDDPDKAALMAVMAIVYNAALNREVSPLLVALATEYPVITMCHLDEVILDEEDGWRFQVTNHRDIIEALPAKLIISWLRSKRVIAARAIAPHLPLPYIDAVGSPTVSLLTEFVLTEFADDEQVFENFSAGVHHMQVYEGDVAAMCEHQASQAKAFANHSVRRIREWAVQEEELALQQAKSWRQHLEEYQVA